MTAALGVLLAIAAGVAEAAWQTEPSRYFLGERPDADVTYIHFGAFNSGFSAGFAIGEVCAAGAPEEQLCATGVSPAASRRIVVRVVRRLDAPARRGQPRYSWRETALDWCPAAAQRLRQMPSARWGPRLGRAYLDRAATPESIVVTSFEGQWAVVSASAGDQVSEDALQVLSGRHEFHGNADGSGNPADWAERFLEDVEPCLREAATPPPWAR